MTEVERVTIASGYGVTLIHVVPADGFCRANGADVYDHRSWSAGRNIIYLGVYDDLELRDLSFFHELGHCLTRSDPRTIFDQEVEAWALGYRLAERHGMVFSERAKAWADSQLATYQTGESKA